jgi:hypothetical protein
MIIKTYPTYSLKITLFEQISLNFKYRSLNMWWSINKLGHLAIIGKKKSAIIFG